MPLKVTPDDQTTLRKQKAPARRGRKPKPKASPKKKASPKSKHAKAKSKSTPQKPKTGAKRKNQEGKECEGDSELSPMEKKTERKKHSDTGAKRGRPKTTPDGETYGCSRCRYAALGCKTCRNPKFRPRKRRGNCKGEAEVAEAGAAPEDPPASAPRSRKKIADKSIQKDKGGALDTLPPSRSKRPSPGSRRMSIKDTSGSIGSPVLEQGGPNVQMIFL